MTERAGAISAFISPSGLFDWLRMPFGLKNSPQIYQRLVDKAPSESEYRCRLGLDRFPGRQS